ncbi:hypothetical protein BLNAU_4879 [Blattamonas nauphoetae]|uniref:Uncharacterized protein n=1 Tax=Blattamonas nauphoetae TaxID=2049346 RepID=A0ABQ9Y8A5_9EUKA|nr:hypothetical protein BLNAU_4879 [Blattamonas nauphoetae]
MGMIEFCSEMEGKSFLQSLASTTIHSFYPYPDPVLVTEKEPFLNFNPNSDLSNEDESAIYSSLVSLVKEKYPFDTDLLNRAARFLENLRPEWGEHDQAAKQVNDPVPSSAGSPPGFVEGIVTLLSSPHSTLVAATLSLLHNVLVYSPPPVKLRLVVSDIITNVLATVQPHTLAVGNETIINSLILIINHSISLTDSFYLRKLGITPTIAQYNHPGIECEKAATVASQTTRRIRLSRLTPHSYLWTLLGCWECADCWCGRTDSGIACNRPEMVCSFGFVVLDAAVFDCHIVNRPLSKHFLASLNDTL